MKGFQIRIAASEMIEEMFRMHKPRILEYKYSKAERIAAFRKKQKIKGFMTECYSVSIPYLEDEKPEEEELNFNDLFEEFTKVDI